MRRVRDKRWKNDSDGVQENRQAMYEQGQKNPSLVQTKLLGQWMH